MVGTGVGIAATCFNVPFDVVKSRFQSQLPHERKYTGVLSTLKTIHRWMLVTWAGTEGATLFQQQVV